MRTSHVYIEYLPRAVHPLRPFTCRPLDENRQTNPTDLDDSYRHTVIPFFSHHDVDYLRFHDRCFFAVIPFSLINAGVDQ